MDYKEKYEQAIENIKKIKAANKDNKELVDFIDYKYPELKEDEDEKIKKAIIHVLYENYTDAAVIEGVEIAEIIAWLEKQGEQKPTWSEEDERFFKNALWHISYSISSGKSTNIHCDTTDWLKSLKQRTKGE